MQEVMSPGTHAFQYNVLGNLKWEAVEDLGHVHGEQMLLCGSVSGGVAADALSHHQHQVLLAAAKRHQVLVGVSSQQFLNTQSSLI